MVPNDGYLRESYRFLFLGRGTTNIKARYGIDGMLSWNWYSIEILAQLINSASLFLDCGVPCVDERRRKENLTVPGYGMVVVWYGVKRVKVMLDAIVVPF